jgi:predicted solute-binding protein
MKRLRISAISYLNTAPLMWDFERGNAGSGFEISYTVPSQCAADLAAGTADIGIIPAAAYASIPGLAILPGVAIASRRPVRSILLVSKVPLDQIGSVVQLPLRSLGSSPRYCSQNGGTGRSHLHGPRHKEDDGGHDVAW